MIDTPEANSIPRATRVAAILALALAFVAPAAPAEAALIDPVVNGNTLTAEIDFGSGVQADLTIEFEQAVGLTVENLGLSVELLDAFDISALASRLPGGGLVSVPAGFPVLLTIEPPATGGLSFSGVASIELYTHALSYVPLCPLRMFAAPLGGDFSDISAAMAGGSYRIRGSKGEFSEFLVVADIQAIDLVIDAKFDALHDLLTAHSSQIPGQQMGKLNSTLNAARSAFDSGDLVGAIQGVESFEARAEAAAAAGSIPNVWRSARDLDNVGGLLRAGADTLRFSLLLKSNGAS